MFPVRLKDLKATAYWEAVVIGYYKVKAFKLKCKSYINATYVTYDSCIASILKPYTIGVYDEKTKFLYPLYLPD